MSRSGVGRRLVWVSALLCFPVVAQAVDSDAALGQWINRVNDATQHRAYSGTYVVSAGGQLASARIWHVCDGEQQVERIESLTGLPRATYRRNNQVVTLYTTSKQAVLENRESLGQFPALLRAMDATIARYYGFQALIEDRLAGFDADAIALAPKDRWRHGYRVWTEKRTGLILKLQTVDIQGRVIEQSAFSELQLDAPVNMSEILSQMERTEGYRVIRPNLKASSLEAKGWELKNPVPGFRSTGCVVRSMQDESRASLPEATLLQCLFSDGLANLSLFIETFNAERHRHEGAGRTGGATHVVTRRIGNWWATAMGEVPPVTLSAITEALERKK